MNRSRLFGYLALGFTLFILLSIPPKKMHRFRSSLVAKGLELYPKNLKLYHTQAYNLKAEIKRLEEENKSLKLLVALQPIAPEAPPAYGFAKVIFRDPAFWASSILINKGSIHKEKNLQKNSPVLSNGYLIGLVEEVFENFSKVRLITDKHLQLSVKKQGAFSDEEESLDIGTLYGSPSIELRTRFKHLEGIYFSKYLGVGDILVTSGLDGVFPEGIPVAQVTEIHIEPEEVSYPFKAVSCAPELKNLKRVTLLEPLTYQAISQ